MILAGRGSHRAGEVFGMSHAFLLVGGLAVAATMGLTVTTRVAGRLHGLGFPVPADDRRIGCVDGLRGYLALSVMIHHFYLWIQTTRLSGTWTAPDINVLNEMGAGAVALFFMATGLVFYPRLRLGVLGIDWPTIYISRLFRIVPLVFVSVVGVTAIIILRTGAAPDLSFLKAAACWVSSWSQPDLLGYADSARIDAAVLWSLKYEWVFYIALMPACAVVLEIARRLKLPTWTVPAALLVGVIALRAALALRHTEVIGLRYIALFPIGMLALEIRERKALADVLAGPVAGGAALAALALGMISTQFPYGLSLPLFAVFFITVASGNSLFGLLKSKGARVLGECSFGVYVLHGILLDSLFVDLRPMLSHMQTPALVVLLPVVMVVAALVAAAAHLWVERPMIAAGKRLARRLSDRLRPTAPKAATGR